VKQDSVNSDLKTCWNYMLSLFQLKKCMFLYHYLPHWYTAISSVIRGKVLILQMLFQSSLSVLIDIHKNWLSQHCHWC